MIYNDKVNQSVSQSNYKRVNLSKPQVNSQVCYFINNYKDLVYLMTKYVSQFVQLNDFLTEMHLLSTKGYPAPDKISV